MSGPGRRWAAVVGVAGVVGAASLVPLSGSPAGGSPLAVPGGDKLLHAVGYAAVAYLFARARAADGGTPTAAALLAVVVATALGGGVEVLQSVVPGRTPSALDAAANAAGAVGGAFAWLARR